MTSTPIERAVYIVSDSTGITAETFSHSVLSQFDEVNFKPARLPFIDTLEKAREVVARINRNALEAGGVPPIVFNTPVNPEILALVRQSNRVFLDLLEHSSSHTRAGPLAEVQPFHRPLPHGGQLREIPPTVSTPSASAWRTMMGSSSTSWTRPT